MVFLFCVSIRVDGSCLYSSWPTYPHVSSTSSLENQPFFKIIQAWWANLWLVVLNLSESTEISIIIFSMLSLYRIALEIAPDYIFVVFSSPYFHWGSFCFGIYVPEFRTAKTTFAKYWLIPTCWLSREHLPIMKLRSAIWIQRSFGFGFGSFHW